MDYITKAAIYAAIEKTFRHTVNYNLVLIKAISQKKGKRNGYLYDCNICKQAFKKDDINVDHISPKVPIGSKKYDFDIYEYYDRVNCSIDNLQVLCKECHKAKTSTESGGRLIMRHNNLDTKERELKEYKVTIENNMTDVGQKFIEKLIYAKTFASAEHMTEEYLEKELKVTDKCMYLIECAKTGKTRKIVYNSLVKFKKK
jgi:hypothetical protein